MAVNGIENVNALCKLPKAEAVEALKAHDMEQITDFAAALWSALSVTEAIDWSTFLLCESAEPRPPSGEGEQKRGVCGKVWKTGDTVYHCRTCGMDPSCAICLECFLNSDHDGHDYWMFSSGGGCCDCGDAEAWRPEGFCRNHCGNLDVVADYQVLQMVSPFALACAKGMLVGWARLMLDQTRTIVDRIVAVKWLTALSACSLAWRRLTGIALTVPGGSSPETGLSIASRAHRAGADAPCASRADPLPSLLAHFLVTEASTARNAREELHNLYFELMRDPKFKEHLLCHIIDHYPTFVRQALENHDPTNSAAADSAATTFGKFTVQFKGNMVTTMVERGLLRMLLDTLLDVLNQALMAAPSAAAQCDGGVDGDVGDAPREAGSSATIDEREARAELARPDSMDVDAEDHPSVAAAAPGLAFPAAGRAHPPVVDAHSHVVRSHLYAQICYDIRYALNHRPIARSLAESEEMLRLLLRSVSLLEGMYPLRRAVFTHVEVEDNTWENAFSLCTEVAHLFPHVLAGVAPPGSTPAGAAGWGGGIATVPPLSTMRIRELYVGMASTIVQVLCTWLEANGSFEKLGPPHLPLTAAYNRAAIAARQSVSYYLPMHRLLAAAVSHGACMLRLSAEDLAPVPGDVDFGKLFHALMEHPLRLQVVSAEKRASLWVRNGTTAGRQCALYRSMLFSDVCLGPDIGVLQLCAVNVGPHAFVRAVLERWPLPPMCGWPLAGDTSRGPIGDTAAEVLLEDLITTFISVIRERSIVGDNVEGSAERTLVHRLACTSAATHSELVGSVPRRYVEHDSFDSLLARLALYTPPRGLQQGTYSIRAATWARFDPFFAHYSRAELHRALDRWQQCARAPGDPSVSPPPPPPAPLAPAFSRLRTLARCGILHALALRVLLDAVNGAPHATEGVASSALRLLAECAFAEEAAVAMGEDVDMGTCNDRESYAVLSNELFGFSLPSSHSLVENALAKVPLDVAACNSGAEGEGASVQAESAQLRNRPAFVTALTAAIRGRTDAGGGSDVDGDNGIANPGAFLEGQHTSLCMIDVLCTMASTDRFVSHRGPVRALLQHLCQLEVRLREHVSSHAPSLFPRPLRGLRAEPLSSEPVSPADPSSAGGDSPERSLRKQRARERKEAILRQFAARQGQFQDVATNDANQPPPLLTTASGMVCDHLDISVRAGGSFGVECKQAESSCSGACGMPAQERVSAADPTSSNVPEHNADTLTCVLCREEWRSVGAGDERGEPVLFGRLAYAQPAQPLMRGASPRSALSVISAEDTVAVISSDSRRPESHRVTSRLAPPASATTDASPPATRHNGNAPGEENPAAVSSSPATTEACTTSSRAAVSDTVRLTDQMEEPESDVFVRMEDLTGPNGEDVMAQVLNVMQAQYEANLSSARQASIQFPRAGDRDAQAVPPTVPSPPIEPLGPPMALPATSGSVPSATQRPAAPGALDMRNGDQRCEPQVLWLTEGVTGRAALCVRFCGHVVHGHCLSRAMLSLRPDGLSLDEEEFSCPLCRRVANVLVPSLAENAPTAAGLVPGSLRPRSSQAGAGASDVDISPRTASGMQDELPRQGETPEAAAPPSAVPVDAQAPAGELPPAMGVRNWRQWLATSGGSITSGNGPPAGGELIGDELSALDPAARDTATLVSTLRAVVAQFRGDDASDAAHEPRGVLGTDGDGRMHDDREQAPSANVLTSGPASDEVTSLARDMEALPLLLLSISTTAAAAEAGSRAAARDPHIATLHERTLGARVPDPQMSGIRQLWHVAVAAVSREVRNESGSTAALQRFLQGVFTPENESALMNAGAGVARLIEPIAFSVSVLALVPPPPELCVQLPGEQLTPRAAALRASLRLLHAHVITQSIACILFSGGALGTELGTKNAPWVGGLLAQRRRALSAMQMRLGSTPGAMAVGARALMGRMLRRCSERTWDCALKRITRRWLRTMHLVVRACFPDEAASLLHARKKSAEQTDEYNALSAVLGLAPIEHVHSCLGEYAVLVPQWLDCLLGGVRAGKTGWALTASLAAPCVRAEPFVPLPLHYSDLYNRYVHVACQECGQVPQQPAMCLLCSQLVCAGGRCCRRQGDDECARHAASCGQGQGAFILLKASSTLLCAGRRHSWWGSLYLDSHGEEDRNLSRGRPLLLNEQRLQALQTLWESHTLREYLAHNPPPFPHLLLMRAAPRP